MPYQPKTGHFLPDDMDRIERLPIRQLIFNLASSHAVTALRAVAEVMLNEDEPRLRQLLNDATLTSVWRRYELEGDPIDQRDHEYAKALEYRLPVGGPPLEE